MFWAEEETEETVTTWQEVSTFYRAWLKSISFSEFDYAERGPICYAKPTPKKEETPGPGLNFAPLIFQSIFYIRTKKGRAYKRSLNMTLIKFFNKRNSWKAISNNL